MGARRIAVGILAVIAGAATATVAEGHGPPKTPSSERTYPQMHPTIGRRHSRFVLTFTLRETPGHQGVFASEYRIQVSRPAGTRAACMPVQPASIDSGAAGDVERVELTPAAIGWCRGTHRVTVFLQRGPYCPPPMEGQPPTPCPEFATQELDTGSASFTVRPKPRR